MKLSDYVMGFVADQGVRHVFMLPGGAAMHVNNSLAREARLTSVCMLHEQACAIAAEAYARTAGTIGVVQVTAGPGGTNAITGLAGAWFESTPVLFISGQVKRADLKGERGVRQLGVQELDIPRVVASLTKYAVTVTDPKSIRFHLEKAVHLAKHGRSGPVWIDLPLDVQATPIETEELAPFDPATLPALGLGPAEVRAKAREMLALLDAAERPVLLAGNGVHCARAERELRALVDRLGVPVLRTWIGADLIPDDHPLCFGKPGTVASRGANFTLQNSDLVVSIGSRLDFAITGYDRTQFARAAKKVVVDIDESEVEKLGIPVDLTVVADAGSFLRALLAELDGRGPAALRDRSSWLTRCRDWKARYPVVLPEYWRSEGCINTYAFTKLLSDEASAGDLIVPGSSGAAVDTFWLSLELKERQRAIATGGLGAMGFGLPAAIGGCIGSGGRRTLSVDGDGGFQLNIQELATVQRLQLPIKFFVINNNGYASIRASQRSYFEQVIACDPSSGLALPDTCRVAEAYGLPARRLSDQRTLRSDIRSVLAAPGPMVVEVMVHPDQAIGPRVSSAIRADGSMASRPLEDLFPFLARDELRENMVIPLLEDA